MPKKILIIAHGHPAFAKGGGELAAYNFYNMYNTLGHDAYFMAAHHKENIDHGGTPFSAFNDKEILYRSTMSDYFLNTLNNRGIVWNEFYELLDYLKPDVIHFHHYIHIGIELIRGARNWIDAKSPETKLFGTLHEYIGICANNGQMVKTGTHKLCYESSPIECAQCFPERNPTEFKLRELYHKSYFEQVDHFISPSHFLKERYVDWGMAAEKISVIENGQEKSGKLPKRELTKGGKRSVFSFFGQINPFKGIDVLLGALEYLPKQVLKHTEIQIHGSGLEHQTPEFQEKIHALMHKYSRNIKYFGAYEPNELKNLMQNIDWVVMPSIWWENAPLVIQESFKYGRPLMVSNIGGMAEKVDHLKNGIHFQYKNSQDIAKWMIKAMEIEFYDEIYAGMSRPIWLKDSAEEHLKLYKDIF